MTAGDPAPDDPRPPIDLDAVFAAFDAARRAGGSAERHYDALVHARPGTSEPALGALLGPIRTQTPAAAGWRRGASGERRTASILAPLTRLGWAVLHDRRIPGSDANLDHLIVGPGAVFVIDSKAYRGRIKLLGDGRLWYGKTPLDDTLATVRWAAHEVTRRLGGPLALADGTVHAVLCLHGVTLPRDPTSFADVTLTTGAQLLPVVAAGGRTIAAGKSVARLATAARARFPPALR